MPEVKILLREKDMPRQWYNLAADLPSPLLPPLTADGTPITPETLAPVFPMNLIEQEVCQDRWVDIPAEVLDILCRWRPTPLRRAVYLERELGTPSRIYYKDEQVSPPGSHKLAFACKLVGLECKVYMVRISYDQKPFRKIMMQVWGAECVPSPSRETQAGRDVLANTPDTPGSLGIAISEAVEAAVTDPARGRRTW